MVMEVARKRWHAAISEREDDVFHVGLGSVQRKLLGDI